MKENEVSPLTVKVFADGVYKYLYPCEIVCCTSCGDYTWIRMKNGDCHKATGSLKKLLAKINSTCFFLADRSCLLNLHYINEITYHPASRSTVRLENCPRIDLLYKKTLKLLKAIESHFEGFVFRLKHPECS